MLAAFYLHDDSDLADDEQRVTEFAVAGAELGGLGQVDEVG